MQKLAILDDYVHAARDSADWSRLESQVEITIFDRPFADEDEAAEALRGFHILCIMRERTAFPRSLLERLTDLRLVVTSGGGNRSLDVAAATERGITVCHTTGKDGSASTVELAWALILACARWLPEQNIAGREGWQTRLGMRLQGKTLGLLGLGKIGTRMAAIAAAFGMKTIAWSQNLTPERAAAAGAERVEKDALLAQADVISIHLVSSARTRGLIGAREFSSMKPGVVLVNTSRGPLIVESALLDALKAGRLACVGLDVYDKEPLPDDHPLRRADNVVLTPHLGYATIDNFRDFYADMVEDVEAWLAGAPIRLLAP
jgi:phosphoglycerate dehydrogenase-like enzyme